MKRAKKRRRPRTPEDFAVILRRIVACPLAANVVSETDIERFAQRLAAAKTDDARGGVMNGIFDDMADRLEQSAARIMSMHGARHPQPN